MATRKPATSWLGSSLFAGTRRLNSACTDAASAAGTSMKMASTAQPGQFANSWYNEGSLSSDRGEPCAQHGGRNRTACDILAHDAVRVDEDMKRQLCEPVFGSDAPRLVVRDRVFQTIPMDETHRAGRVIEHRDADDAHAARAELRRDRADSRRLLHARRAPRREEIDVHAVAALLRERERSTAVGDERQREGRSSALDKRRPGAGDRRMGGEPVKRLADVAERAPVEDGVQDLAVADDEGRALRVDLALVGHRHAERSHRNAFGVRHEALRRLFLRLELLEHI